MRLYFSPRLTSFSLALSTLLLSSCMVGPDWQEPKPTLPDSWQGQLPPKSKEENLRTWWKQFNDPQLTSLIQQAENNNQDLQSAILRVLEAREMLTQSFSKLLPSLDSSLNSSTGSRGGLSSSSQKSYAGALDLSWELDFFGGNRRALESTFASFISTTAESQAVKTSLLAEVATLYFDWLSYSEQILMAKEQLLLQQESLRIAETRHQAGYVSLLDVEQAKASVASTEASIPQLDTLKNTTHNALASLLGTYPQNLKLKLPSSSTQNFIPTVPTGLPSELLRRRPDIIQAENNFYAACSQVGVAMAERYPKFSLSGGIQSSSGDFSDWFSRQNSNWSLGGMVRLPLFNAGALAANVRKQELAYQRAGVAYEKALTVAVKEVENSLVSYANSKVQLVHLKEASLRTENAFKLSLTLYTEGESEFLNVVTAQRQMISAKESVIATRQRIRQSAVQLAKALGGGW